MTQTPEEKAAAAEASRLWLYFRLTPEMVLKIEAKQREQGLAMLMGTSTVNTGTDHCHATGLIRGRMDFRLNKALGLVEAFTNKLTPEDLIALNAANKDIATARILHLMSEYMLFMPAPAAVGDVYGLINKAKRKKHMVYGSPNGPLPEEKKPRKPKTVKEPKLKTSKRKYVMDLSGSPYGAIGNTD